MAVVIIGGKEYIIYEMCPTIEPNNVELIKDDIKKKEKKSREQSWKQMARFGYRKK